MANIDNQSKKDNTTDQRMVSVPVRLAPETLDDFRRMNPTVPIRMVRIGAWKYPCAIYELPEGEADTFLTAQQTEAKREQREARCLIPDGTGGFVRCDEKHKCWQCERYHSFDFDNMHPTSLDAFYQIRDEEQEARDWTDDEEISLKENGAEDTITLDNPYGEIMDMLVQRLSKIRPKYGLIFQEMLKGNTRPLNIAKALNLGKSQIYDDVPMVQEAAKKIYFELMDN